MKQKIPYDSHIMVTKGSDIKAKSIETGSFALSLVSIARSHIEYMVSKKDCNHDGFNKRYKEILKIFPNSTVAEIVAMGNANSVEEAAELMWKLWKKSPKHWGAANSPCNYYVYSLGYVDKIAYGIGLIVTQNSAGPKSLDSLL